MPSGPVGSAGAWTGPQAQQRTDRWLYECTAADAAELRQALTYVRERGLTVERIAPRVFHLPTFGPTLQRFTRDLAEGLGFVLIRGFPVSGLSVEDMRLMYFGAMTYLGIPIAQDGKNTLIGNVRNEGGDPQARGYQTGKALGYHSDSADMVALFCVRPAQSGGLSRIMSAVTVHNIIQAERPDLLEVLYDEPYYPAWSHHPQGCPPYYWARFFSWYQGRLHTSGIKEKYADTPAMSARQKEALDFVRHVQTTREADLMVEMEFRPGDVQVLDNSIVWHSRTAYVDPHDPAAIRHLLRIWLNYTTERPLAPDYWNRYELVGQASASPKRRLFDVEIYHTW
jgi:hypothetical protein